MLNHIIFPKLQVSELYSLFSNDCSGDFWYSGQIYEDQTSSSRYQSSLDQILEPYSYFVSIKYKVY